MNNDTISLLQECSAGANMAMSAIDQVLEGVENPVLHDALTESRRVHDRIGGETRSLLRAQGQEGKAANPVAQSMAWLKTNWKLTVRPGDETVADLIVDGCNMGVKSLTRYQNQYPAASGHGRAADRRGGAAVKRVTALPLKRQHHIIASARFDGSFSPMLRFEKLEILRSRWRRRSLTDAAMPLAGTQSMSAFFKSCLDGKSLAKSACRIMWCCLRKNSLSIS